MISIIIITTIILLMLLCFIISIMFLYQKKQMAYVKNLEDVKNNFEQTLLTSTLEIREEAFQNIAREIHDNINLSLTLAKLYLHTTDLNNKEQASTKVASSIDLLAKSINDLSNISKGLNTEVIIQQGLIKALEYEVKRINQAELFRIYYKVVGIPRFLDGKMELIIFRIVQEAFNNIIKHAKAKTAILLLNFQDSFLTIHIRDHGVGFNPNDQNKSSRQAGLKNMESRTRMLNGQMKLTSKINLGTTLSFTIPFTNYGN